MALKGLSNFDPTLDTGLGEALSIYGTPGDTVALGRSVANDLSLAKPAASFGLKDALGTAGAIGSLVGAGMNLIAPGDKQVVPMQTPLLRAPTAWRSGVSAMSSVKAKENIEDADSDIMQFLESLDAKKYNYREESGQDPNQLHYGVMAEDMEKSDIGSEMVSMGDKYKQIDFEPKQFNQLVLAVVDSLHDRIKKLEGDR